MKTTPTKSVIQGWNGTVKGVEALAKSLDRNHPQPTLAQFARECPAMINAYIGDGYIRYTTQRPYPLAAKLLQWGFTNNYNIDACPSQVHSEVIVTIRESKLDSVLEKLEELERGMRHV